MRLTGTKISPARSTFDRASAPNLKETPMISASPLVRSEVQLMATINKLSDAGGSVIQVRTREPIRAAVAIRKHLLGAGAPHTEWDVTNGFRRFTTENYGKHTVAGDNQDFLSALTFPLQQLRQETSEVQANPDKIHYFVYLNPHPYIKDNPRVIEQIQQYAALLPTTNVCTLFITPDVTIHDLPVGTLLVADLPTPTADELSEVLARIIKEAEADKKSFPQGSALKKDDYAQISNMGLGLSLYEFETYCAIAIIDAGIQKEKAITAERILAGVADGKTAVVRQSEILELTHAEDIENVGGMGRLKKWLAARALCYSDEAKDFGIQAPKGIVVAGVPGTGKSLVAKVTASVLGVPLVRLDFGRVFSKYVGDSESRVRDALKMVERMAPVVLFVDEIDKGLGGAGGGGDSGTSSRVLGSYLTWLQECTAPVFNIVTANRVNGLPPELLRRGRFDEIFSAGLPYPEDRKEVLSIHLRKRGRDISDFTASEVAEFISASEGYVPAEIESAVKDALIAAFNDDEAEGLEMRHLLVAIRGIVPMSKSHKEDIDRIVAWAQNNATPVSDPPKATSSSTPARRRIVT